MNLFHLLQAVSAFAPICNPIQCPWGQKAFSGYLGTDRSTWEVRHPPDTHTHLPQLYLTPPFSEPGPSVADSQAPPSPLPG